MVEDKGFIAIYFCGEKFFEKSFSPHPFSKTFKKLLNVGIYKVWCRIIGIKT
jgi:hypothetical protein